MHDVGSTHQAVSQARVANKYGTFYPLVLTILHVRQGTNSSAYDIPSHTTLAICLVATGPSPPAPITHPPAKLAPLLYDQPKARYIPNTNMVAAVAMSEYRCAPRGGGSCSSMAPRYPAPPTPNRAPVTRQPRQSCTGAPASRSPHGGPREDAGCVVPAASPTLLPSAPLILSAPAQSPARAEASYPAQAVRPYAAQRT